MRKVRERRSALAFRSQRSSPRLICYLQQALGNAGRAGSERYDARVRWGKLAGSRRAGPSLLFAALLAATTGPSHSARSDAAKDVPLVVQQGAGHDLIPASDNAKPCPRKPAGFPSVSFLSDNVELPGPKIRDGSGAVIPLGWAGRPDSSPGQAGGRAPPPGIVS